ncbi:MAG: SulP family inorganic anion transporter [Bacteroidetes bacterium]|nr:SulP family inorganic anion transporter [Bacteroidota bacterium]
MFMQKQSIFSNPRPNFISGLIVFLIALPLCLGIAQASHAPLFAGVVAGIIGGIVVGFLSPSQLSVTGPAAGLTAIVLAALTELKAFDIFLCSVIIAGAVQLILGFVKAGGIANYIPSSVIEGMLAGIGLTIIIKQLPDAVGYVKNNTATMTDADDGFMLNFITGALQHIQPAAIVISVTGIVILLLWQTNWFKKMRLVPAGLIVVLIGTIINQLIISIAPGNGLDSSHLVSLPIAGSASEFIHQFTLPNFSGFSNIKVWETGLIIAIVASIETLLCIEATDKMDPLKRYTSPNKELKAQGIGNIISGLLGGLPLTSVIVRTSANINAGAKSKLSTIIHGVLLLICVASIPVLLNLIPKASLAAILIFTGYRLCKPSMFRHMWKGGLTEFIPFIATLTAVVALDLLKGVGIGLLISIFYILRQNMRIPYYYIRNTYSNGDIVKLTLAQEVSFLNKASIKTTLDSILPDSNLIIDASKSEYINFDVLDIIREFHDVGAREKNIKVSLVGFKDIYKVPKTYSEKDLLSSMLHLNEIPERTSGTHRELLQQLAKPLNNQAKLFEI